MKLNLCLLLFTLIAGPALAVIETYEFSSEELETRYRQLSFELRCPKCQNQNIADSNAPIAKDLRQVLYQQLEEGASDKQILDHMVARYGEFVRYRPSFNNATAILWLAPVILLLLAVTVAVITIRGRRQRMSSEGPQLSRDESQRLDSLLGKSEKDA